MSSSSSAPLPSMAARRIEKEAQRFNDETCAEVRLEVISTTVWHVHISGVPGTIYQGENFVLRVTFDAKYPMECPEIMFLSPAPVHPHVYSNGHICLNILYEEWSPALTVRSVCMSILSMLSSCTEKALPPDNARYTMFTRGSPKNTKFMYHDDSV